MALTKKDRLELESVLSDPRTAKAVQLDLIWSRAQYVAEHGQNLRPIPDDLSVETAETMIDVMLGMAEFLPMEIQRLQECIRELREHIQRRMGGAH